MQVVFIYLFYYFLFVFLLYFLLTNIIKDSSHQNHHCLKVPTILGDFQATKCLEAPHIWDNRTYQKQMEKWVNELGKINKQ